MRRRLRWIRRQQRVVDALPPPETPREWVAGETHRYLGRQYRLKLQTSAGGAPDRLQRSVRLVGRYFAVSLPDPKDRTAVRDLMGDWYRTHAQRVIAERVRKLVASTHWLELDPANPPAFRLQALTHRWGSTTRAGRITFNRALIRLPLGCIDYVVAHELVHLRIPNHSPAFWRMLERVMPDWRQWRERLGREGV